VRGQEDEIEECGAVGESGDRRDRVIGSQIFTTETRRHGEIQDRDLGETIALSEFAQANLMVANQSPTWLQIVAAIPAAVMVWTLLARNPKRRRQWFVAAGMMVYIAGYYWLFVRGR
jgi:hypothetical protein